MQRIEAQIAVSLAELEANTTGVLNEAKDATIAVLSDNQVVAYRVPADAYEALLDRLDDLDLIEIVRSRSGETGIPVDLDDLSA